MNQRLAVGTLERLGHQTTIANHGLEVLTLLQRQEFDLILMDIQMPELDGLETTKRIREQEKRSGGHMPIIAVTAHALKGDRERCLDTGTLDTVTLDTVTLDTGTLDTGTRPIEKQAYSTPLKEK